jgi:hypothetical protein
MGHRLLIVVLAAGALAIAPAVDAVAAGPDGTAATIAKKQRCKVKKVHGKRKRVCTKAKKKAKKKTTTPAKPATPPATANPTPAPSPAPASAPPAAPQATRDDAAGQAKLAGGDLLLERAEFGSSGRTATYTRIFLYGNGVSHLYKVDWNDVSGEICSTASKGTWVFKEGYRYAEQGGGTIVKITTTANGQSGDDILVFPDNDSHVYVGTQLVQFERNPNMRDSC